MAGATLCGCPGVQQSMGHWESLSPAVKPELDSGAASWWWCSCMAGSECGLAMAWQVAALPLPVHAAKTGDAMEQSRAKTVAMERKRRITTQ